MKKRKKTSFQKLQCHQLSCAHPVAPCLRCVAIAGSRAGPTQPHTWSSHRAGTGTSGCSDTAPNFIENSCWRQIPDWLIFFKTQLHSELFTWTAFANSKCKHSSRASAQCRAAGEIKASFHIFVHECIFLLLSLTVRLPLPSAHWRPFQERWNKPRPLSTEEGNPVFHDLLYSRLPLFPCRATYFIFLCV